MAHTSKWVADRQNDNRIYIYGGGNPDAMQGQLIAIGTGSYPYPKGDSSAIYVYGGGMSDQGEIRTFGGRPSTSSVSRDLAGVGSFRGEYYFEGPMAGAIVAGDGYGDDTLCTFGSNFRVRVQSSNEFSGIVRSIGSGAYDVNGKFEGVMSHGDVEVNGGDMTGQILGFFVPDIEITGGASNFTGRIEAFDSFRGGALRLAGANNGTIRAGGQDMTYTQGTIAAGATLNLTFGNGTLDVTADPGNAGTVTYSYVYSGTGERVQALRFESSGRDIASIVGSGVTLESIQIEGSLDNNGAPGSIDLNDDAANGLDSGLRSLRVNRFEGGDTIDVEGEFGQFIINGATGGVGFEGNITTTPGPVAGTGADLTGMIFMRSAQPYNALANIDIGGDVREYAGFYSYGWWNTSLQGNVRVRGDLRGMMVFPYGIDGNLTVDGDVAKGAWILTQDSQNAPVTGNITIGGDMAGYLYIGDGTSDPNSYLSGSIDIGGDLSGYLNIYDQLGITPTGSIHVGGELTRYIYLRDPAGLMEGSITIDGGIGGDSGYIYIPGNLTGTIDIGGDITSRRTAGAIDIGGDITSAGAYSISVNNVSPGSLIVVDGDASTGAEMRINGDFDGLIRVGDAAGEMFGDVRVATNPSSSGRLRAYNDNNAATLYASLATQAQLTYQRDNPALTNNDPDTLFGVPAGTVLNPGSPTFTYVDSDGDTVDVTYAAGGTGTVTLYFVSAGLGQDLVDIVYAGATATSDLLIDVVAVAGNGITTAGNIDATGQTFGTFQVEGWIESWTGGTLAAGETLSTDYNNANGDVTGLLSLEGDLGGTLDIGGVVTGGVVRIEGDTLAGSAINTAANGFYDAGLLIGGTHGGSITVGGVGQSYAGGQLHGGRNLTGTSEDPNPFDNLTIAAADDLIIFWDGVHDVDYGIVYTGTTVGSAYVSGHIDSFVASDLDFDSIRIDGRVKAVPDIEVGDGTISNTGIGLDITNGNVGFLRLDSHDHPDYTVQVDGDLGDVRITQGMLEGTVRTINGGNLTGEIWTAAGEEIRGRIEIDGDITATGAIMPGGTATPSAGEDISGQIVVNGNMDGMIYAYDLGKDVDNGYDILGNPQVWPLKGSITVGGNVTGGIDIANTMMDYSFIDATGTIATATFDGSNNLLTGVRIQDLAGTGALAGRIRGAIDLDNAINWSIGDDVDNSVRTFALADQNLVTNAWLTLDGRNIGGGWGLESPTIEIQNPISLANLNTLLNGISYDGTLHTGTTLASISNVTLSDFTTGGAGTLTVLNVGNLDLTAEAMEAGDTLNVANDVWGKVDLGANAMDGLIDIGGNVVYDGDNGSDGWIYSTGRIADYTGAAGIRVQGLNGTGVLEGRITTALDQPALTSANTFVIGDDAAAGTRTFTTPVVAGLTGSPKFLLTLDGRFYDAGDAWAYESPTLELYSGSIDQTEWETIRTSGITYDGVDASGGLSLAGTVSNPVQFAALTGDVTMYNLGGYVEIGGDPSIPDGVTLNITNTLWGTLTVGTYGDNNISVEGGGTIAIGKDLTGNLDLIAQMNMINNGGLRRSTISVGRNFTEGAEIDYTPWIGDDFYGDITIGGDWVGVFDINGYDDQYYTDGDSWDGTDIFQVNVSGIGYRATKLTCNGNFGAPTVTGALVDIAGGRIYMGSVPNSGPVYERRNNSGFHFGNDGTGIMYGDIDVHQPANWGGFGTIYTTYVFVGDDSLSGAGDAYMAHTSRLMAERFLYVYFYVYGGYVDDTMQGQVLAATNQYAVGGSGIGIGGTIYMEGGSTDQAEIRALRAPYRYAYTNMLDGNMFVGITFRNTFRGAIAAGDGYDTNDWPSSEPYPEETYAYFGRYSGINFAEGGMDGIIRSFGRPHEVAGVSQGIFQNCEIDVGSSGTMNGTILGYYVPDIEMNGGFTGRIEAFNEFKGGGVRISGVNTGTIRANNTDLNYYQFSVGAGATLNLVLGNGQLSVTADAGNAGAMTCSFLYSGSGEHIEAFRTDSTSRHVSSIVGTGITMSSLFMEGDLTGAIDFNDDLVDGLDTYLHSVRIRRMDSGETISVEGDLGQVLLAERDFNGDITTTIGTVGTSADLLGVIHNRQWPYHFVGGTIDIAGDVRENAGILAYYEMQAPFTFNVGGDMNGVIGSYRENAATINITGSVNDRGRIRTYYTTGNISGNITVGGDFGGWIYCGDSESGDACAISGAIDINGQLTSTGRIFAIGTGGITGSVEVGDGVTGIQDGGRIRTYRGPLSGSITVQGDIAGGWEAIRVGTSSQATANITGTGSVTVNGDVFGGINVYGTAGIQAGGSVTINGSLRSGGFVYVRNGNADLAGTITVTGSIQDTAYIRIEDDVTATGLISVGGNITSTQSNGAIDINGNLAGTVDVTGNIDNGASTNDEVRVSGNLSGSLLASLFGDVTIGGSFSGTIGRAGTANGVGNTLTVGVPGGGGSLVPGDLIFANRIGYP